jgi:hypothetical protein
LTLTGRLVKVAGSVGIVNEPVRVAVANEAEYSYVSAVLDETETESAQKKTAIHTKRVWGCWISKIVLSGAALHHCSRRTAFVILIHIPMFGLLGGLVGLKGLVRAQAARCDQDVYQDHFPCKVETSSSNLEAMGVEEESTIDELDPVGAAFVSVVLP